jgi:serine/threonine protein kinase
MALAVGARLGSYQILGALGAGGMGEVFHARDTRLGRDVAIKVVLESFLADRDRLLRFEREAKALAALNHPNIATLYGMEEFEGRHVLVMELVPGVTLSERLTQTPEAERVSAWSRDGDSAALRGGGPPSAGGTSPGSGERGRSVRGGPAPRNLKLEDTLSIAHQIADALEAAHEKGIVHRDLKPANVKITPDDKVKVLDFGLAKASPERGAGESSASLANSPTLTAMGSQAGMILGTASYMSPEQARGLSGDHRSDIFSFGVVLYEMLTGRQPFHGETVSDVLASVLAREPDFAALPGDLSPRLTELVTRCLEKHPKRRWQAMGDVRHELEVIAKNPRWSVEPLAAGSVDHGAGTRTPAPPWRRALAPLGALALGAAATAAFMASRPAPAPSEAVAFEISTHAVSPVLSLSPDGRSVVYGSLPADNGPTRLWLRSLASLETRPIPGTEGAFVRQFALIGNVVWSPDSRSIVYASTDSLNRVDVTSGQTTNLVKVSGRMLMPGGWSRDGTILYGQRSSTDARGTGIWRIADTGGTPVQVTEVKAGDLVHRPSGFLPDGRRFLYQAYPLALDTENAIRVGSIDRAPSEQDNTTLFTADGPAVYAPPGSLLFVKRGSLAAQPFDANRGVLAGASPVQVASGTGPMVSVSENGRLLYSASTVEEMPQSEIVHFDRRGAVVGKIGPPANYGDINVLPDGVRLSVARSEDASQLTGHLHIVDPVRGVFTRLHPGTPYNYAAAIAPDNLVAYTYSPEGVTKDIYVRQASGVDEARLLVSNPNAKHPNSWTRDGRFLIYDEHVPDRSQDLMMVRREGGQPVTVLATEWDETFAMVSPDNKWLAYRSTDSGRPDVYVRDFHPDRAPVLGSVKIQISVAGGDKPRWSPDGREIFYFQGETMMAVSVRPDGSSLTAGVPAKLFNTKRTSYIPYDVRRDGTFVVNVPVASTTPAAPTTLRVLMNWETLIQK